MFHLLEALLIQLWDTNEMIGKGSKILDTYYMHYTSPQCHSLLKPRADLQDKGGGTGSLLWVYDCEV